MAATGYWRDQPEGGFRRGLVPGSGLRRRASLRGVAEATARYVPRLLLAFPPVAPLWDLGRRNEIDQPTLLDPPRPPHPTRPFRDRSRHVESMRISPWHPPFCRFLSDFRTFRSNSNLAKPTVELKEDLCLPKRLYRADSFRIPLVFRSDFRRVIFLSFRVPWCEVIEEIRPGLCEGQPPLSKRRLAVGWSAGRWFARARAGPSDRLLGRA